MTYGVYDPSGIRHTTVSGSTRTGLFAADGSYNVVIDDTTYKGLYHPCGAFRVSSVTNTSQTYDASGAYYLSTLLGTPPASAFASGPAPAGYHWDFVTLYGERVTFSGQPTVMLVANGS